MTSTQTFHKISYNTIILEKRDIKFFLCHTAKQTNSFINSYFSETYSCIFVKDKKPESIGVL